MLGLVRELYKQCARKSDRSGCWLLPGDTWRFLVLLCVGRAFGDPLQRLPYLPLLRHRLPAGASLSSAKRKPRSAAARLSGRGARSACASLEEDVSLCGRLAPSCLGTGLGAVPRGAKLHAFSAYWMCLNWIRTLKFSVD